VYDIQQSSVRHTAVQCTTCSSPVYSMQKSSTQHAAVQHTACSSLIYDLVCNLYVLYFQYLNYSRHNAGLCEKPKHVDEFFKYISCNGMLLLLFKYKTQRDEQHTGKMN